MCGVWGSIESWIEKFEEKHKNNPLTPFFKGELNRKSFIWNQMKP